MSWYLHYYETKSKNKTKAKNKKLCKEIFYAKFIVNCIKIYENYEMARTFITGVWKYTTKIKESEIEDIIVFFKKSYIYLCENKNMKPIWDVKEKIIREEFKIYTEYKKYSCNFSKTPINKTPIIKIPKLDLSRRKAWGYKWTQKEEVIATLKHYILHSITPGNQWTMLTNERVKGYIERGFNIEVFGSPFNTRLQYFGSLYKCDEPFGRIGTYQEILDKVKSCEIIKWRNEVVLTDKDIARLLICPPSGSKLLNDVCNRSIDILNIRKGELYLNIPYYISRYDDILKGKYYKNKIIMDKSWDFYSKINYDENYSFSNIIPKSNKDNIKKSKIKGFTEISMKGREWILVLVTNLY